MRAVLAMVVLSGCFYTDPINERPSADIVRISPDNPVRGDTIRLYPEIYDPDGNITTLVWTARACAEASCEQIDTSTEGAFDVPVPLTATGLPTSRIEISLEVTDSLGATAVPRQDLDIPIGNAPPQLQVQTQGRAFMGRYPVDVPVTIVARKSDFDDGAANVTIDEPTLYAPVGASIEDATLTLVEETDTEVTWELVASMPGQWELELTARDPFQPEPGEVTVMEAVPVAADQSPCLAVAEPGFPPAGATIVLDEPRRFAVLAVEDDLDVFPAVPNDPYLGAATFRWFFASPATGGALEPLDVEGSGVDLDPGSYTPGDELALRVEVVDREDRDLCDSTNDSCAAVAGCFQRQTWRVEVR